MHVELEAALRRMQDHFSQDDRCLAMYVTGSLAARCADEFSDIDVAIVVSVEYYAALKAELEDTCEKLCGKLLAWLPEGEQSEYVNYAFLFEAGKSLNLCDLMLVTTGYQAKAPALQEHQILFDRTGVLRVGGPANQSTRYTVEDLSNTLRTYWVYAYLDGKYFQRRDIYKMLYVQYALFLQHVNLFKAFQPDLDWGWWARDVKHIPEAQRDDLLIYFGATKIDDILSAFGKALDLFSRDAQSACHAWNVAYPLSMEQGVRAHLKRMGCLVG